MKESAIIIPRYYRIPEHIRSVPRFSGAYPFTCPCHSASAAHRIWIPEDIRSFLEYNHLSGNVFRHISVHIPMVFRYLGKENTETEITMAGKPISMSDFKQAILLKKQGMSNRSIATALGINKETVNNKFAFIASRGLSFDELLKLDDVELQKVFHGGHSAVTDNRHEHFLSRLDYFREQLRDRHMTRYLLWEEYRKEFPDGYSRSQFYHHLAQNLKVAKVTTVLSDLYVPGHMLMIDYAGDTLPVVDPSTGEVTDVQVFVATMPFSDYAFAYAVPSQNVEDFIHALRMCLEYLGGVPQIVKLDNLKAGVIRYDRHEPELNKALQDMGNHYHFFAQPCRPRKPTDKALVESCVRRIYNRVYAKLRKMTFFSIGDLNKALSKAVHEHNQTRMQRRPYSRQECFVASEKEELQPLPATPFELIYTAEVKVQMNCHVLLSRDNHYYSVSHIHVGKRATLRYTRSIVKIFIDGALAATHRRSFDRFRPYVTDNSHMASNSAWIRTQSVDRYCQRALAVCPELEGYVRAVFDDGIARGFAVECRYKTCDGIMANARRYAPHIVVQACEVAVDRRAFSAKAFGMILESMDRLDVAGRSHGADNPSPSDGENLRGKTKFA